MRTTRVTEHRAGKTLHFTRHITPKSIAAAKRNVKVARKEWMSESHLQRQKEMPSHRFLGMNESQKRAELHKEGKRYVPVGGYAWLDVGRKEHHYVLAQKTKFGWNTLKYTTKPTLTKLAHKAREVWMHQSHAQRAREMPSRAHRAGYKRVALHEKRHGKTFTTHEWERMNTDARIHAYGESQPGGFGD